MSTSSLAAPLAFKPRPLHVECCLLRTSTVRYDAIARTVHEYVLRHERVLGNSTLAIAGNEELKANVESLYVCGQSDDGAPELVEVHLCEVLVHVFQLDEDGSVEENGPNGEVPMARQWALPSRELHGLWDNLIFDSGIKNNLLDYAHTTLLFSDCNVDANIVAWNRVILLHGPPGTGKTSLCKSIAQKLAIRLSHRYRTSTLIEVNSHSLFSKWFSESGKLVLRMFQQIQQLTEDEDCFVCVLIDEVESLTSARESSLGGGEPSDAVRVVNALLTQIDLLKRRKNVMILTTSNLSEAIDAAFLDRADIKQYIGLPRQPAIYHILRSCVHELMRVNIIQPGTPLLEWNVAGFMQTTGTNEVTQASLQLYQIAQRCEDGLSGRALRKLPFLAHAYFVQTSVCTLFAFVSALDNTVTRELENQSRLRKLSSHNRSTTNDRDGRRMES